MLVALVSLSACVTMFGEPYDWNNPQGPKPSKAQRAACNAACDSEGQRSDRNDAMCHFACVSLGDPWYTEHDPAGRPIRQNGKEAPNA